MEAKAEGEQCAREGKVSAQYQAARSGTFPPGLTHSQPPPRKTPRRPHLAGLGRAGPGAGPELLAAPGPSECTPAQLPPWSRPGPPQESSRAPAGFREAGSCVAVALGRVAHARKRSPGPRASCPPHPAARRPQSDEDRPPAWGPTSRQSPTQLGRPSQSRLRVGKTVRPSRGWRPHCDGLPRWEWCGSRKARGRGAEGGSSGRR